MKILKHLSIFFTTIAILTSCEQEIIEPYGTPSTHSNGNNNITIDADYPNLSGKWLFVEVPRDKQTSLGMEQLVQYVVINGQVMQPLRLGIKRNKVLIVVGSEDIHVYVA